MARYNARFALTPADPQAAFAPLPDSARLHDTLAWHILRKASAQGTISYQNQRYRLRLSPQHHPLALRSRTPVTVVVHLDGSLSARHQDQAYLLEPVPLPATAVAPQVTPLPRGPARSPAADHPWRQPWARRRRPSDPVERYFLENHPDEPVHPWG